MFASLERKRISSLKCLKSASYFEFLKLLVIKKKDLPILIILLLFLARVLFHCSLHNVGVTGVYDKSEPDHLLLKASWHLYCALCRHSHDLKISSGLWILLSLRDFFFYYNNFVDPSLRADGAFKPENNPFLELGQRLAV